MGALREPLAGLSRGWVGLIARLKPATFSTCRNRRTSLVCLWSRRSQALGQGPDSAYSCSTTTTSATARG